MGLTVSDMKNKNNPVANALSLFAGIGGFEVGMASCGFKFLKTLEWDAKCCETLQANKDLLGVCEESIAPIDITKMPPENFYNGEVDYIVGGPPCQSFSAAGRRAGGVKGTKDARGELFNYYCKYVDYFKPKAFVFENVRGILSANKGEDFRLILKSFESVGYRLFWRILNAADFGVPQLRERVFLVGIRKDLKIDFKFPLPTYGPDSPDKKKYNTVGEVISSLQDDNEVVPPYGGKYGHLLPDIPPGENYRFYTEEMGHPHPLFAWRSKFSNFLYKMDPNDVCKTIIAYQGRYDGPFHWKNRKCTTDELKLMQGFPEDFKIPQSYTESVKQIGNSVCPPIAHQIGMALRYQIEHLDEFKVPLIENGQKLSFDKSKGIRARKTRKKIANHYSDIMQVNLFDSTSNTKEVTYKNFTKKRDTGDEAISWRFVNGNLTITIKNIEGTNPKETKFVINFFGNVTSYIKKITVKAYADISDTEILKKMWDEVHLAIKEMTSFDSLMPLYGHFTEPYPKFKLKISHEAQTPIFKFQDLAISDKLGKDLQYEEIADSEEEAEALIKKLREYGYDVRSHNTNVTIPEGYFKICYPFTIPNNFKQNITWHE